VEVVKAMESLIVIPHYGYVVWHSHIYIIFKNSKTDEVQMKQEIPHFAFPCGCQTYKNEATG